MAVSAHGRSRKSAEGLGREERAGRLGLAPAEQVLGRPEVDDHRRGIEQVALGAAHHGTAPQGLPEAPDTAVDHRGRGGRCVGPPQGVDDLVGAQRVVTAGDQESQQLAGPPTTDEAVEVGVVDPNPAVAADRRPPPTHETRC